MLILTKCSFHCLLHLLGKLCELLLGNIGSRQSPMIFFISSAAIAIAIGAARKEASRLEHIMSAPAADFLRGLEFHITRGGRAGSRLLGKFSDTA